MLIRFRPSGSGVAIGDGVKVFAQVVEGGIRFTIYAPDDVRIDDIDSAGNCLPRRKQRDRVLETAVMADDMSDHPTDYGTTD